MPAPLPQDPSDPLSRALDEAVRGRADSLRAVLARGSHLPGARMNEALAEAFAHACRRRGEQADGVALELARLSAREAPGATSLEFLPVCGVYAISARAAAEPGVRGRFLSELHARADDLRFRVRDAVVRGLGSVGQAAGDGLVVDVSSWMDGYFQAAAVLRALSQEAWAGAVRDAPAVASRVDEAFGLLSSAPRAAARWPGYKELSVALGEASPAIALRFGVPVLDVLARWGASQDAAVRAIVGRALDAPKLAGRFAPEVAAARRAIAAATPPPRNPDHDVGPTRDRSRRRRGRSGGAGRRGT